MSKGLSMKSSPCIAMRDAASHGWSHESRASFEVAVCQPAGLCMVSSKCDQPGVLQPRRGCLEPAEKGVASCGCILAMCPLALDLYVQAKMKAVMKMMKL